MNESGQQRESIPDAMNTTRRPGHISVFTPDDADASLLSFVLNDDDSLERWTAWRRLIEIEDVAGTTHELLPAAYKRLESLAYEGPELGRLKGIYRYHWTRSQQARSAARAAGSVLTESAIEFLAPADQLTTTYLADPGILQLRPPRISVRYEDSGAAIEALLSAGWSYVQSNASTPSIRSRLVQTEWDLQTKTEQNVTITNFFMPSIRDRLSEREVWRRSARIEGTERTPSPLDLFLAAIGSSATRGSDLRWALATLPIARAHKPFADLKPVIRQRVWRYLLPAIETRLAFLDAVAPEVPSLAHALETTRVVLAEEQRAEAPATGWRAGTARPIHLVGAAVRILGRYGGLRGTRRYLQSWQSPSKR